MATLGESAEQDSTPEASVRLEVEDRTSAVPGMPDLDYIRGLIEAVDGSGIDALEITRAGTRIKLSKTPQGGPAPVVYGAPPPPPPPAPAAPAVPAAPSAPEPAPTVEATEAVEPNSHLIEITSPMVGTFYRAPAPDAPPYVEPGTRVRKGQTLCILEAMKLMNELESEADGVIREILVENAEPVEYGQVLFLVEPD